MTIEVFVCDFKGRQINAEVMDNKLTQSAILWENEKQVVDDRGALTSCGEKFYHIR